MVLVSILMIVLTGCAGSDDADATHETASASPTESPASATTVRPRPTNPTTLTLATVVSQAPTKVGGCGADSLAPGAQDPRPVVCGEEDGKQVAYTLDAKIATEVTVESAVASRNQQAAAWSVQVTLEEPRALERLTLEAIQAGRRLAVVYEGEVVVAAEVTEPLTARQFQISNRYTEQQAQALADRLNDL